MLSGILYIKKSNNMNKKDYSKAWKERNREAYLEAQKIRARAYYYKHREEMLAKKQKKYARDHGQVIVETSSTQQPETPTPPAPETPVIQTPPQFIHPLFKK